MVLGQRGPRRGRGLRAYRDKGPAPPSIDQPSTFHRGHGSRARARHPGCPSNSLSGLAIRASAGIVGPTPSSSSTTSSQTAWAMPLRPTIFRCCADPATDAKRHPSPLRYNPCAHKYHQLAGSRTPLGPPASATGTDAPGLTTSALGERALHERSSGVPGEALASARDHVPNVVARSPAA